MLWQGLQVNAKLKYINFNYLYIKIKNKNCKPLNQKTK